LNDNLDQAAQTAVEHGAVAAAAAGGGAVRARPSRTAALAPDTPQGVCANCTADLHGPVCHNCGQVDDAYHRPVRGLLGEMIEGLTALDGRVARTLPTLLLRPGRVTRAYLKGARARFMPPFRLYIIASLIFFLLLPALDAALDPQGVELGGPDARAEIEAMVDSGEMSRDEADEALAVLERIGVAQPPLNEDAAADEPDAGAVAPGAGYVPDDAALDGVAIGTINGMPTNPDSIRRFFTPEDFGEQAPQTIWPLTLRRHVGERFAGVQADPGGWLERAAEWVPRIMFVMVPVYALLLSLVYAWRRSFFFYDHLIVSLHFHSALFLTGALLMIASGLIGPGLAWLAALIYANAYLYRLHRVVYARGRVTSALRTLSLDVLYLFVLGFGLLAVLLLGALA